MRHSYDKGDEKAAIHMVSAWASSQKLVLGQVKVDKKSNEITAIPKLIKLLSLNGCIVTIDAMGCQREIVKLIGQQVGDYVITLNKNQSLLYERVEQLFKKAVLSRDQGFIHSGYREGAAGRGRKKIRYYSVLSNIKKLVYPEDKWAKLYSVIKVDYVRRVDGLTQIEIRYFISSLASDAKHSGELVWTPW